MEKKDFKLVSEHYENTYILSKKRLHYLLRKLLFETSEIEINQIEKNIENLIKNIRFYSKESLKYAKKLITKMSPEKQNSKNVKLMLTMKEIDYMNSNYYYELYLNKDILKAWKYIDKIKQFLVLKAFKENLSLHERILKYFGEEWSLIYVFAKICLLQDEIEKRESSLSQEWQKEIFQKANESLRRIQVLFKYEMANKKDYNLKIITSTFSGGFSEYFLHDLCLDFYINGIVNENTPTEFRPFLECVKNVKNKKDIVLNDFVENNKPDIDIHLKGEGALFLKNAKINSNEIKKIWREIELCQRNNISIIFYGINFIKNIEGIEYIRRKFQEIKN